jgi:hypothetical protein
MKKEKKEKDLKINIMEIKNQGKEIKRNKGNMKKNGDRRKMIEGIGKEMMREGNAGIPIRGNQGSRGAPVVSVVTVSVTQNTRNPRRTLISSSVVRSRRCGLGIQRRLPRCKRSSRSESFWTRNNGTLR